MKALLAILGVTMGMVLAAPVHAEPGIDEEPNSANNGSFLADLCAASCLHRRPSAPSSTHPAEVDVVDVSGPFSAAGPEMSADTGGNCPPFSRMRAKTIH